MYHVLNRLIYGVFLSQSIKDRIIHLEKIGPFTKAMNSTRYVQLNPSLGLGAVIFFQNRRLDEVHKANHSRYSEWGLSCLKIEITN